ncbi:hypothetical protein KGY77_05895 [Candidatus Bipolaricaulota bacterium]|nr:hypothetical protein [Candidatus Bipolaricaulota bacterium]
MFKISDITEKYGLSKRQVRYRLTQLDNLLEGHVSTGKNQVKLIDDYGMSLFDRLMELEKNGRTTSAAVEEVKTEIEDNEKSKKEEKPDKENVKERKAVVDQLEARIEDLKQHNRELKAQLERKDQQIQQLLPAAKEENSFKDKSLWQVIKEWLKQPAGG